MNETRCPECGCRYGFRSGWACRHLGCDCHHETGGTDPQESAR